MCLRAVTTSRLESIEQIFMESGHSQMEVDSVHSTIENASRNQNIYAPTDYYSIVKLARRHKPYEVSVMDTDMFHDYKALSHKILQNKTKTTYGSVVRWLKIKWIKYEKQNQRNIFFKYNYDDDFQVINVSKQPRGRRLLQRLTPRLSNLHSEPPKISVAKYNDLVSLSYDRAIPADYHHFYTALKCDRCVIDTLPEPDICD